MKLKRRSLTTKPKPRTVIQHLAVDDFAEVAGRKRQARTDAGTLGHTLGTWHRRPNDPYGRWNAYCLDCNAPCVVATELPDGIAAFAYGHALTQRCA